MIFSWFVHIQPELNNLNAFHKVFKLRLFQLRYSNCRRSVTVNQLSASVKRLLVAHISFLLGKVSTLHANFRRPMYPLNHTLVCRRCLWRKLHRGEPLGLNPENGGGDPFRYPTSQAKREKESLLADHRSEDERILGYGNTIECFHSRGQHLCKFIGTKESVCIRKELNSHRIGLGHQHGRRFNVLGHQYGRRFIVWDTNMAAVSLFWDTNMAAVTSCENTLYRIAITLSCIEY